MAPVFCNQVEYHPFLEPGARCSTSRARHDVLITAYSPLAHGKVPGRRDAPRDRRGARQDAPARSRCAGCSTSRGVSPIPKASSHERRAENFDVFDFELSRTRSASEIDALPKDVRTANPPWAPDWDA